VVVLNRNGQISINDAQDRELERHTVPHGSIIRVGDGKNVEAGATFVKWDPYTVPILTEVAGRIKFEDIKRERNDERGTRSCYQTQEQGYNRA